MAIECGSNDADQWYSHKYYPSLSNLHLLNYNNSEILVCLDSSNKCNGRVTLYTTPSRTSGRAERSEALARPKRFDLLSRQIFSEISRL